MVYCPTIVTREMRSRVFNNKIKQKNKNHPEGEKTSRQAGRQAGRQKTGAQSNMTHSIKDNGLAQDCIHQEAK